MRPLASSANSARLTWSRPCMSDIRHSYANVGLRHMQDASGEQRARAVRLRRAGIERVFVLLALIAADGGARLHRVGGGARIADADRRDMRGAGEGGCDRRRVAE